MFKQDEFVKLTKEDLYLFHRQGHKVLLMYCKLTITKNAFVRSYCIFGVLEENKPSSFHKLVLNSVAPVLLLPLLLELHLDLTLVFVLVFS